MSSSTCWLCQERPATWQATRGQDKIPLCDECKPVVEKENRTRNAVKRALSSPVENRQIFTQTLGANLLPNEIHFEKCDQPILSIDPVKLAAARKEFDEGGGQ